MAEVVTSWDEPKAAPRDFNEKFDTILAPHEERQFGDWKKQYAPRDSGADYDLRGAFKAGLKPVGPEAGKDEGHWPDTFKKPNHPTFSDQSRYAAHGKPGRWEGDTFVPPASTPVVSSWDDEIKAQPALDTLKDTGGRLADIGRGVVNLATWPMRGATATVLAGMEAVRNGTLADFPEALDTFTEAGHLAYKGPKDIGEVYTGEPIATGELPEQALAAFFGGAQNLIHGGAEKLGDVTGSPALTAGAEVLGNAALFGAPLARGRSTKAGQPEQALGKPIHEQLNEIRPVSKAEAVAPRAAEPAQVVTEWTEPAKPAAEAAPEAPKPSAEAVAEPVKPGASVEPAPPAQAPQVVTGWEELPKQEPVAAGPTVIPPEAHESLRVMAANSGWLEQGGRGTGSQSQVPLKGAKTQAEMNEAGMGSTVWVGKPEWAKGLDLTVAETQAALEKAIAGKKLGARQQRAVDAMMEEYQSTQRTWEEAKGPELAPEADPFEYKATADEAGLEWNPSNVADLAKVDEARRLVADAVERIPDQVDDATYMRHVEEIINAKRANQETAARGEAAGTATAGETAAEASARQAKDAALGGPDIVELNAGLNPAPTLRALRDSPLGQKAAEFGAKIVDDLQMKLTPMAAKSATDTSRAVAKEFANQERLARWQWGRFDDILKENYTPEQRAAMGKALDEQSVLEQTGQDTTGKGLATLPADQREAIAVINQHGRELWERAKAMGMVQGEGLPSYMPRMVVNIGEDGAVTRIPSKGPGGIGEFSDPSGQNITTTTPNLRQRKYLTAAETEAAAKEHFGEGASLVTDIRALPAALARFERAIAGRELIDKIKTIGKNTGKELVSEKEGPTSFTIDHPAFKTYRPRFVTDEATGKTVAMLDQQGNPVFDKVPLYVANEFKGPLKAIMSEKSGAVYNALMSLKGKTMSVIMYSPLIHNEVEFGRAFALMPIEMSKVGLAKGFIPVPKIYLEGNRIKHQPEAMREAISNGLVPIGKRFGFQDITGMMEEPNVAPGRSITAQVLGGAVGVVSKKAGEAVKRGVDTAGDVWHNTLLWDRVGDLQMGLYGKFKEKALAKGLDEKESSILAAHFANRYAGVIPNEVTSHAFRKASNFIFFSRSFTGGNIGAMKDAVMGMPRDVVAQLRNAGADEAAQANASELSRTYAQRKAVGAIIKDVALAHLGVALVSSALDYYHEQDFDKILEGYRDRWERLLETAAKDPWDASNPFEDLRALSPTSENEAGKQDRIRVGTQEDGTAIYMRLPLGKIGEEMEGYMVSPVEMMRRKVGTIIRPLIQVYTNDQGYGREVYNPNAKTLPDMVKAVFDAALHVATNQFPVDSATAAKDIIKDVKAGREPKTMDELKAIGPLAGVTFSKGAPGGPAVGEMFDVEKRHRQDVQRIQKDVKKLIENGEIDPAIEKMRAVKMSDAEILITLKYAQNPGDRLGGRRLGRFYQHAPEADQQKMERLLEKR